MEENNQIKVSVRVRPLIARERSANAKISWEVDTESNSIARVDGNASSRYTYDHVLPSSCSNADVYAQTVAPLVESAMAGYNGTCFAYGITASGKTYTIMGDDDNPGIIPRAVDAVFESIDKSSNIQYLVRASYVEIYKEVLLDLVTGNTLPDIHEKDGDVVIRGLEETIVRDADSLMALLCSGQALRHTAETNMNERSSRSHTIFRLVLESRKVDENDRPIGAVQLSQLNIVDLAGSERVSQTGATGERLKEGAAINLSLLTLTKVIKQLTDGSAGHVSFRESKLTRILKNSLGGNAKTCIICNVTPAAADETEMSLKFAARAKAIRNKPVVNAVYTDKALLRTYEIEMELMKTQLKQMENSEDKLALKSENEKLAAEVHAYKSKMATMAQNMGKYIILKGAPATRGEATAKTRYNRRLTWAPGSRHCPTVSPAERDLPIFAALRRTLPAHVEQPQSTSTFILSAASLNASMSASEWFSPSAIPTMRGDDNDPGTPRGGVILKRMRNISEFSQSPDSPSFVPRKRPSDHSFGDSVCSTMERVLEGATTNAANSEAIALRARIAQLEQQVTVLSATRPTAPLNATTIEECDSRTGDATIDPNLEMSAMSEGDRTMAVMFGEASSAATVSTPSRVNAGRKRESFMPEFSPLRHITPQARQLSTLEETATPTRTMTPTHSTPPITYAEQQTSPIPKHLVDANVSALPLDTPDEVLELRADRARLMAFIEEGFGTAVDEKTTVLRDEIERLLAHVKELQDAKALADNRPLVDALPNTSVLNLELISKSPSPTSMDGELVESLRTENERVLATNKELLRRLRQIEERTEPANRSGSFMELLDFNEVENTVARQIYDEKFPPTAATNPANIPPNITITETDTASEIGELRDELVALQGKLEAMAEMEGKLADMAGENERLLKAVECAKHDAHDYKWMMESEKARLAKSITELRGQLLEATETKPSVDASMNCSAMPVVVDTAENDRLREAAVELEARLADEAMALADEKTKVETLTAELDTVTTAGKERDAEHATQTDELDGLRTKLADLEEQLVAKTTAFDELLFSDIAMPEEKLELTTKVGTLRAEAIETAKATAERETAFKAANEELAESRSARQALVDEQAKDAARIVELDAVIEAGKATLTNINADMDVLRTQCSDYENALNESTRAAEATGIEHAAIVTRMTAENEAITAQLNHTKRTGADDLIEKIEMIKSLKTKIVEMEMSTDSSATNAALRADLEKAQRLVVKLREQKTRLTMQFDEFDTIETGYTATIERLNEKIATNDTKSAPGTQMFAVDNEAPLRARIAKLEGENASVEDAAHVLRKEVKSLRASLANEAASKRSEVDYQMDKLRQEKDKVTSMTRELEALKTTPAPPSIISQLPPMRAAPVRSQSTAGQTVKDKTPVEAPARHSAVNERESVRAIMTASKENLNISVQTPTRQNKKKGVIARLTTPKSGKASPRDKLGESNKKASTTESPAGDGDNTRGCNHQ